MGYAQNLDNMGVRAGARRPRVPHFGARKRFPAVPVVKELDYLIDNV